MQRVGSETDLLDRIEVVVDQDADPLDFDRLLDALDRLVERRLAARKPAASGGTPAAVDLTTGTERRTA
jgi:hypothetical protein